MSLKKLLLGSHKPNKTQLKFFADILGDLSKAIFLGTVGLVFLPTQEPVKLGSLLFGSLTSIFFAIMGSRLLRGVNNK